MLEEPHCEFPIWKTIRLSTGLNDATGFLAALCAGKCGLINEDDVTAMLHSEDYAKSLTPARAPFEVDLVKVSLEMLQLDVADVQQVMAKALAHGLSLCLAEVGPQLRLQYDDQPNGEWLCVAMKPLAGRDGKNRAFSVIRNYQGKWLGAGSMEAKNASWTGIDYIFVRPRK